MRLYSFANMYLSDIQKGIQTAHVVSKMSNLEYAMFNEWARYHHTIIVLNGGNSDNLRKIHSRLSLFTARSYGLLPVTGFYEDEQSLDNALTCVGIILPEKIYDFNLREAFRHGENYVSTNSSDNRVVLNSLEYEIAKFIKQFPLA